MRLKLLLTLALSLVCIPALAQLVLRSEGAPLLRRVAGVAPPPGELDVPFEPTHPQVVAFMLQQAAVGAGDIVYDLGCGDGRIVVAAVKDFHAARGVGFDLDPQRIREAEENAQRAGVSDRVHFAVQDIMTADIGDATVVTLYLLNEVNLQLRPRLFQQLRPGTRVISHAFTMGDWDPDQTLHHPKARGKVVYLWIIPAPVGGRWSWDDDVFGERFHFTLDLNQEFQFISGTLSTGSVAPARVTNATLKGKEIAFDAEIAVGGKPTTIHWAGTVDGDRITGQRLTLTRPIAIQRAWVAARPPADLAGTWRVTIDAPSSSLTGGGLLLSRESHGSLIAEYQGKPVWDCYTWGASIRFDVPSHGGSSAVFCGRLEGDTLKGVVSLPDSTSGTWTAVRAAGGK